MSRTYTIENSCVPVNMEISKEEKAKGDSVAHKTELNLTNLGLSEMPKTVILENIVRINLERNNFAEFPLVICSLERLKSLNVASNKIKVLPNEVGNLCELEYFNCSDNCLETFPSSFSMVTKLVALNVSKNSLVSIPDEMKSLKKLEIVNLSHNKLKEVPLGVVCGSSFISHLHISYNILTDFSKEPKCSSSLKSLMVNNNRLTEVPVWMRCLQGVEELCLSNNPFSHVPHHPLDDLMPLPSLTLTKLSMSYCGLKNLPKSLKNMPNLSCLEAGNDPQSYFKCEQKVSNIMWDLTPAMCLSFLKELRLPYVGLPVLPDDFWTSLNNLEIIGLEGNVIVWLPDGLSSQKHLRRLLLSCNRLALVPNEIGAVKSLKELRLDGNKLHELPDSIGSLENLTYLDLYDNELSEIPPFICNLSHLEFLDLEYNQFNVEESENKDNKIPKGYDAMREGLRVKLCQQNSRHVGSKDCPSFNDLDADSGDEDEGSSDWSDYQPNLEERKGLTAREYL
ncbi:leucine-rich repeat protein soc-2-like isoform X2 [Ischnura elegans]|uniref:leucine-rich repeat protein soc-2-like isoform X2 n=1 Tax=Ischnura elegans TaxID=197161 RepID=UPI001ED89AA0|nr:leucine-rich repeat protein soc-2-like isoform X2 [Ischnura elegans]